MTSSQSIASTRDVSLVKTLLERAKSSPECVYVGDIEGRTLTYRETVDHVRVWAAAYQSLGVGPGDHVVTMQYNTIESVLGWLGLAWMGAVEAPINTDYRGGLLVHALNLTQARVAVCLRQFVDRFDEVAGELEHLERVVIVDGEGGASARFPSVGMAKLLNVSPAQDLAVPRPWDIMAVLFTSGTTGPSKAVQLPWAQIHAMTTGTYPLKDLGPDEVIYNSGPTYHVGAKVFPYLAGLCGGRHLMRPFISRTAAPEEYLKFGVTTGGVIHAWMDEPPRPDDAQRPLRNLLTPYRDPQAEAFADRFGCRRFGVFNMTEVSCPIVFRDWDAVIVDGEGRVSCGAAREGYDLAVVDDFDQPVADGQAGELIVRARAPWLLNAGYLNNAAATARAWRNGWFHTGDAFLRDKDGNYYFLDRMKDCIRRHGENISSFEVEAYVNGHPAVARSAAVAVKRGAHAGADEEIKIVVELIPGEALDAESLIRWLIPRAPRFMIPRYVEFMDALPLTPTQKVRKTVLRETGAHERVWDREAAGVVIPRHAPVERA